MSPAVAYYRGRSAQSGFTLTELVVGSAIAAVVLSIAAPGITNWVMNARQLSAAHRLLGDLHLARTLAISRGEPVTLCQSVDGGHCGSGGDWAAGWILFADRDESRTPGEDEPILLERDDMPDGFHITFRAFGSARNVTYYPTGWTWNRNGTFTFCDRRGAGHARALILHRTGRVRHSFRASDGSRLRCE